MKVGSNLFLRIKNETFAREHLKMEGNFFFCLFMCIYLRIKIEVKAKARKCLLK